MRRLVTILAALLALLLLALIVGLLILRTGWFREKLRQRVVSELERVTGGRVEIARLDFDAKRWHGRAEAWPSGDWRSVEGAAISGASARSRFEDRFISQAASGPG